MPEHASTPGQWFVRVGQRVGLLWQRATNPSTERLSRLSAWAQLLGLPFGVLGGAAGILTFLVTLQPPPVVPAPVGPSPPPVSAPTGGGESPDQAQPPAQLRVSRLVVQRESSYFVNPSEVAGAPGPTLDELEFIPLGNQDRDTWVPGPRWIALNACRAEAATARARARCGDARRLRPVFDVIAEAENATPAVIQSLRLVIQRAAFPQGSGPGPLGLPTATIPRSATYQIALHPEVMAAEDGRWRHTEIDLSPPLNVVQGTAVRFSLALGSPVLEQPTTVKCHIEIGTTDGQQFRSPALTLFFP